MGGSAFATHTPPLPTPRMPPKIYEQVLNHTKFVLSQHYTHVESPVEAPGKTTFGDVDILVTGALNDGFDPEKTSRSAVADNLVRVMGAVASIYHSANPTINLAVPWSLASTTTPSNNENITPSKHEARFVQIDVHHLTSPANFKWELFHAAHGDLWSILGATIRAFGLTVNNRGLYLRIPEIEMVDRKKSLIFLTEKPSDVLEVLGLDESRWWSPFKDQEEMFEYAASCRMFWVEEKVAEEAECDAIGDDGGQESGEAGKKKSDSRFKQRMAKRSVFNDWFDKFVPKCREEGRYRKQEITREEIREDAFNKFGVQKEYGERLTAYKLLRHRENVWLEAIKGSIPIDDVDPQIRAAAVRVMKAVIMEGEDFEGGVPDTVRPDKDGFYDISAVEDFVQANWEKAGNIGMARQQARALQAMKEKAEKRAKQAEEESKKVEGQDVA